MSLTLLIMAAGLGSRYGGLKQLDPVGPNQETIIDYSIYDARQAGFDKLVFVIRREIAQEFRAVIGRKFENRMAVKYVFQELDDLPPGFTVPAGREKPWGTGHAVLVTAPAIAEPFAVINADDFYGRDSFEKLAAYLQGRSPTAADYALVGFVLRHTLSEFGTVSRGLCQLDEDNLLEDVVELTDIKKVGDGAEYIDEEGQRQSLSGDEIVSMNMWGFTPLFFSQIQPYFEQFLQQQTSQPKAEFYIPTVVNRLIKADQARVKLLSTESEWFGVTYQEDRPHVERNIRRLVAEGRYPANLWPQA